MKIRTLFIMLAVAMTALATASCSDDPEGPNPAAVVEGTYRGSITYTAAKQTIGPVETSVVVSAEDDTHVTVRLTGNPDDPSLQAFHQDLVVRGVRVLGSVETFTLAETAFDEVVDDVHYVGTVSGSVLTRDITLTYVMTPGSMPFSMTGVFKGSK